MVLDIEESLLNNRKIYLFVAQSLQQSIKRKKVQEACEIAVAKLPLNNLHSKEWKAINYQNSIPDSF